MQGIYIAAIVTTLLSLIIIGGFLLWRSSRKERAMLVAAVLLMIPMCAIAFYFIRLPLDGWLQGLLGRTSEMYKFLTTLYAPVTEEPIKLWVLLMPWFLNNLERKNTIRVALAIGLGFGIGEMWLIATKLANNPQIASLPWYSLSGYMNERFMVCIMHGTFTAVALSRIRKGFILGILGAIALHFLGNFPIYLAGRNFGGLGKSTWQLMLHTWVIFYFICMLGLLIYLSFSRLQNLGFLLYGKAKCPECRAVYSRPLFAINMVTKRYERCPVCKGYHWTRKLSGSNE